MDSGNKKSPEEAKTVAARRGAAINLKSGPQRPLVIYTQTFVKLSSSQH